MSASAFHVTRAADGVRVWFTVLNANRTLRTGLVGGNFTVTIIRADDAATNSPTVVPSTQLAGVYYFDVPSAFLTTSGDNYFAVIQVTLAPVDAVSAPLFVSASLWDQLETEASAATRESTNTAEHAATLAAVGLVETEAAAATREATNTAEHATTLAAVGTRAAPGDAMTLTAGERNAIEAVLAAAHGSGQWDATAVVPQQDIRDAMKLAPSGGAPAGGSIDALLGLVETEAAAATREATNTAEHAATLAAVGLVETEASAATREATNTAEHAATLAAVGALAFATPADIAALEAHGDLTWATAVGFETEASAATREATNTAEHAATLAAVGALPGTLSTAHGAGSWEGGAALSARLDEVWTVLGLNPAAPASFDSAALFVQALAAGIDIAISVVGTTVTLTRAP
jgi:hypothetical protein